MLRLATVAGHKHREESPGHSLAWLSPAGANVPIAKPVLEGFFLRLHLVPLSNFRLWLLRSWFKWVPTRIWIYNGYGAEQQEVAGHPIAHATYDPSHPRHQLWVKKSRILRQGTLLYYGA